MAEKAGLLSTGHSMRRDEALRILAARRQDIETFGVQSIAIFGSVARDEAGPESDIDILVEFASPPRFDQYMGLKFYLEDLLRVPVDLASLKTIRPRIRSQVESELIRVA